MAKPHFQGELNLDKIEPSVSFAQLVRDVVARIPAGRVITYGDIALAIGAPRNARRVGWVLNSLPDEYDLPCHRVVNRDGYLSGGWKWGHPDIMKNLLLDEAVPFKAEYTVDIQRCRWFPDDEPDLSAADEMDDFDLVPRRDRG